MGNVLELLFAAPRPVAVAIEFVQVRSIRLVRCLELRGSWGRFFPALHVLEALLQLEENGIEHSVRRARSSGGEVFCWPAGILLKEIESGVLLLRFFPFILFCGSVCVVHFQFLY